MSLEFGDWNLIGIWGLVIGHFLITPRNAGRRSGVPPLDSTSLTTGLARRGGDSQFQIGLAR
jgi:hypothetical protein